MYFGTTYGHPHGSSARLLGTVKSNTSFNGVTGSGGRLLSCSWVSRKGNDLPVFWVGFIKLIGKEQWENSDAFRRGGCSCSTSSVPAQGQPWLSDGHHGPQQTSTMLCLYLAGPAPPKTAPGHSLTSKFQPSPFPHQLTPALTSQLILLPPSPSFHPKNIKS